MHRQSDGMWTVTRRLGQRSSDHYLLIDGQRWIRDPRNPHICSDGYGGWVWCVPPPMSGPTEEGPH
jgi:hypothetical protein